MFPSAPLPGNVRHRGGVESYVTAGKFKMNNKDKHHRHDSIPKGKMRFIFFNISKPIPHVRRIRFYNL